MFDELMLPDSAVMTPISGGGTTISMRIRLPWYRSLPISCIEQLDLAVDDLQVLRDTMTISLGDVPHTLDQATHLHETAWFVLDQATVRFSVAQALSAGSHQVSISLTLRIPYTEPDFFPLKFTQVAQHARAIEFVGRG